MSQDRDDIGIDARLRRALASAPDAQVEPPAVLDEAILRAAHAAVPKPAAMSGPRESQGFFASLKRWWTHPAAAPVFAVLALSTVIVSMWTRHGIPSPTADDDSARMATAPALEAAKASRPTTAGGADASMSSAAPAAQAAAAPAAPAPAATAASAPTAPAAPAPAATEARATDALSAPIAELRNGKAEENEKARAQAKTITPKPAARPQAPSSVNQVRSDGADARALADKKADAAPPPKEASPRARQESAAARREAERDESVVPAQAAREVAVVPAPAMAPASTPAPPPSTPAAEEGRATAGTSATTGGTAPAPAVAKSPAVGSVASTLAQSAPTASAAPSRDASLNAHFAVQDAPPLARTLDATANWQWRAEPSQPLAAIDDRARAWFARLAAASQGRWASSARAVQTERATDARVFELWREQVLWATIVIGPADVTWLDASGRAWRAVLAPDASAALRSW